MVEAVLPVLKLVIVRLFPPEFNPSTVTLVQREPLNVISGPATVPEIVHAPLGWIVRDVHAAVRPVKAFVPGSLTLFPVTVTVMVFPDWVIELRAAKTPPVVFGVVPAPVSDI